MSPGRKTPREVTVQIDGLSNAGLGTAELDGKPLQVRNALPGELVQARILKRRQGILLADGIGVEVPAAERTPPACEFFPRCGGCNMHHLQYARQLALKQAQLAVELERCDVTAQCWASPRSSGRSGYRHKARLGVRKVGDQVLVGFRESFSNRVAKLTACVILTPQLSRLIVPLRRLVTELSVAAQVPQIEFASGEQLAAVLVRHLLPFSATDLCLLQAFEEQYQVQLLLQSGGYDSLCTLAGGEPSLLNYRLPEHGLNMQFAPHQFIQVNLQMNHLLIADALDYLQDLKGKVVADLFCGIGNFSLPLRRQGARVQGFEMAADVVQRAQRNADLNGLSNGVQFTTVDLYRDGWQLPNDVDALLLDPPRSGAGLHLAAWLARFSGTEIVYVSCNPVSFADDAAVLKSAGFVLRRVGIYDMFPHTANVETMGYFTRRKQT